MGLRFMDRIEQFLGQARRPEKRVRIVSRKHHAGADDAIAQVVAGVGADVAIGVCEREKEDCWDDHPAGESCEPKHGSL